MQFWTLKELRENFLKRYLHTYTHGIIHKNQEAEAAQVSMDEWIDENEGMYI